MISKAGTTGTSEYGWYCATSFLTRVIEPLRSCSPSEPSDGGAGGAVERDHPPARERELAAARQLNAGADDGEPLRELVDGAEATAQRQHLLVGADDSS